MRLYRRESEITGISYGLNGIAFPGSKLGKMFSLPKVMEAIEQGREQERERLRVNLHARSLYLRRTGYHTAVIVGKYHHFTNSSPLTTAITTFPPSR